MTLYYLSSRKRWLADLRNEGGTRKTFDTKRKAVDWINNEIIALKEWGAKGRASDADMVEFLRVRDMAAKAGCSLEQAVRFYAEHSAALVDKPLGEAVEAYLEAKGKSGKRQSHMRMLKWVLRDLEAHAGADTPCHAITAETVEEWADTHEWNLGSTQRRYSEVKVFFDFCCKARSGKRWCTRNPMDDMEEISVDRKPPQILTVEQCRQLLQAAIEHERDLVPRIALRLFGGLRNSEVEGLTPEQLRKDNIDLHEATAKGGTGARLVPINDTLRCWLEAFPPVFPMKWKGVEWARLNKRVGELPRNALRHTAATMAYHRWGPADAARRLGHSEAVLHGNYRGRLDDLESVDKFWAITPVLPLHREPALGIGR